MRDGEEKRTSDEISADDVMLNPEYLKRIREGERFYGTPPCLGRPLTKEELDAIFRQKPVFGSEEGKSGLSLKPWFSVKMMKVDGKMRPVPFIGIEGTF